MSVAARMYIEHLSVFVLIGFGLVRENLYLEKG